MHFNVAFIPGSAWSVSAFVGVCLAVVAALIVAAGYTSDTRTDAFRIVKRLTLALFVYIAFIATVVYSGIIAQSIIPNAPIFLGVTVAVAVAFGFTPIGTRIAMRTPLACLVGFQGFRLPLELILHEWYTTKTIPETMTWSGSNWDIISGILALALAPFVVKRRWLAWLANLVGIVLLLNVARVAILSLPSPIGWQSEPPLELVLFLPYAYIVPLCVGGAVLGHILLTRRLLQRFDLDV